MSSYRPTRPSDGSARRPAAQVARKRSPVSRLSPEFRSRARESENEGEDVDEDEEEPQLQHTTTRTSRRAGPISNQSHEPRKQTRNRYEDDAQELSGGESTLKSQQRVAIDQHRRAPRPDYARGPRLQSADQRGSRDSPRNAPEDDEDNDAEPDEYEDDSTVRRKQRRDQMQNLKDDRARVPVASRTGEYGSIKNATTTGQLRYTAPPRTTEQHPRNAGTTVGAPTGQEQYRELLRPLARMIERFLGTSATNYPAMATAIQPFTKYLREEHENAFQVEAMHQLRRNEGQLAMRYAQLAQFMYWHFKVEDDLIARLIDPNSRAQLDKLLDKLREQVLNRFATLKHEFQDSRRRPSTVSTTEAVGREAPSSRSEIQPHARRRDHSPDKPVRNRPSNEPIERDRRPSTRLREPGVANDYSHPTGNPRSSSDIVSRPDRRPQQGYDDRYPGTVEGRSIERSGEGLVRRIEQRGYADHDISEHSEDDSPGLRDREYEEDRNFARPSTGQGISQTSRLASAKTPGFGVVDETSAGANQEPRKAAYNVRDTTTSQTRLPTYSQSARVVSTNTRGLPQRVADDRFEETVGRSTKIRTRDDTQDGHRGKTTRQSKYDDEEEEQQSSVESRRYKLMVAKQELEPARTPRGGEGVQTTNSGVPKALPLRTQVPAARPPSSTATTRPKQKR